MPENETDTKNTPQTGREVSEEETRIAYSVPAPLANRIFLHIAGLNGRIAFAESPPGKEPVIRSAVTLSIPDLIILSRLIDKVVKEHSEKSGMRIEFADAPPNA